MKADEEYEELQNDYNHLLSASLRASKWAQGIVAAYDALVRDDVDEAVFQLTKIADPTMTHLNHFENLRRLADKTTSNEAPVDVPLVSGSLPLTEDQQRFVEWISCFDDWHWSSVRKQWEKEYYRSRTTQELYEYYQKRELRRQ
ncbi:MAG TPA: hypothetical protein PL001_00140 [Candidatus Kryptobacter bacterium]|nr:hypothetical protein [Candidatus Kryptobacter bacterium]